MKCRWHKALSLDLWSQRHADDSIFRDRFSNHKNVEFTCSLRYAASHTQLWPALALALNQSSVLLQKVALSVIWCLIWNMPALIFTTYYIYKHWQAVTCIPLANRSEFCIWANTKYPLAFSVTKVAMFCVFMAFEMHLKRRCWNAASVYFLHVSQ